MFNAEHLQQLYRYACAITNDEQQASDLLQDAVETCLRKPPNSDLAVISYTRTIIRNRFIDLCRKQSRFPLDSLELDDSLLDMDSRSLEDVLVSESELEAIWDSLKPLEREILFLWAVEEHTISEIAQQINVPRGTILSHIHRLRKRLQNHNKLLSTGTCL